MKSLVGILAFPSTSDCPCDDAVECKDGYACDPVAVAQANYGAVDNRYTEIPVGQFAGDSRARFLTRRLRHAGWARRCILLISRQPSFPHDWLGRICIAKVMEKFLPREQLASVQGGYADSVASEGSLVFGKIAVACKVCAATCTPRSVDIHRSLGNDAVRVGIFERSRNRLRQMGQTQPSLRFSAFRGSLSGRTESSRSVGQSIQEFHPAFSRVCAGWIRAAVVPTPSRTPRFRMSRMVAESLRSFLWRFPRIEPGVWFCRVWV